MVVPTPPNALDDAQFLAQLAHITQEVLSGTNVDALMQVLVARLGHLFGADSCHLTAWSEEHQQVSPITAYGVSPQVYRQIITQPNEPTLSEHALRLGKPLAVEDVHHSPYISPRLAHMFPTRSALVLPLIAQGQKLGAAIVGFHTQRSFSPQDIARAEQVASLIALAMLRFEMLQSVTRREAWFKALLENNQDIVYVVDAQGWIRYASPNALAILGYNPTGHQQAPSLSLDYIHPQDRDLARQLLQQLIAQPQATASAEMRVLDIQGRELWMDVWARNLLQDPAVGGIVVNLHNITARKRAEDAVRQNDVRNRAILEALPDAMLLLRNHELRSYKPAGGTFSNQPQLAELFDAATCHQIVQASQAALQTQEVQRLEYSAPVGGALRHFEMRLLQSGPQQVLGVVRDVTEQKQLERSKTEFLHSVTHELKTPLSTILGFAELALSEDQPPETEETFQIIYDSGLRLKNMINNLLDSALMEEGRFQVGLETLQLNPALNKVASSFEAVARLSGIAFELSLSNGLPAVQADPERLVQVVGNLLSNAFKFTPRGGVVKMRSYLAHQGVAIEVQDTGPGLSPNEIATLFTRYGRAASAIKRGVPGTGLGLYISKAIAQAHGGRLEVQSEVGKGALFRLWLPLPPQTTATTH